MHITWRGLVNVGSNGIESVTYWIGILGKGYIVRIRTGILQWSAVEEVGQTSTGGNDRACAG